jgi:hypothetical protein
VELNPLDAREFSAVEYSSELFPAAVVRSNYPHQYLVSAEKRSLEGFFVTREYGLAAKSADDCSGERAAKQYGERVIQPDYGVDPRPDDVPGLSIIAIDNPTIRCHRRTYKPPKFAVGPFLPLGKPVDGIQFDVRDL